MPKQMSYNQATGATCPQSYWVAEIVYLDSVGLRAVITYRGYMSKSTHDAGDQPIDEHQVIATTSDYTTYFSPSVLASANIYTQADNYAGSDAFFIGATTVA